MRLSRLRFFFMAGTSNLEACVQFIVDQGMNSMIAHVYTKGISDPVVTLAVGGKAFRLCETEPKLLELVGSEGGSFAWGNREIKEGGNAAGGVEGKPAGDRIAADTEKVGKVDTSGRLSGGDEVEHLETFALVGVVFTMKAGLEVVSRFDNDGHCAVHGGILIEYV